MRDGKETAMGIRPDYSARPLPGFGSGNEGDAEIYRNVGAHAGPVLADGELEPICGRESAAADDSPAERDEIPIPPSGRGTSREVPAEREGFELEPVCGRERSGSPQAKSREERGT